METFKRGNIVFANLPLPKDQQTHEQTGIRPVLIIQDEEVYHKLPTIMIIPFTTKQEALRFPSAFFVDPSSSNGLVRRSVLLPFQMMAIDKRRLTVKIGEIEDYYLNLLEQSIKSLMGLR